MVLLHHLTVFRPHELAPYVVSETGVDAQRRLGLIHRGSHAGDAEHVFRFDDDPMIQSVASAGSRQTAL